MDKFQVVFDKIKEIIVQELNVKLEKVTLDAKLVQDFGADSLGALELFNQVESEFLINIDDESASKMRHVKDLVEYVSNKVKDQYFE